VGDDIGGEKKKVMNRFQRGTWKNKDKGRKGVGRAAGKLQSDRGGVGVAGRKGKENRRKTGRGGGGAGKKVETSERRLSKAVGEKERTPQGTSGEAFLCLRTGKGSYVLWRW